MNNIPDLPKGILPNDLKRDWGNNVYHEGISTLTFYKVIGRAQEWMIGTLFIRNPSRRQRDRGINTERTYAIGCVSEKLYTIGCGPHVAESISVHFTNDNLERLMPYIMLYIKGLQGANACRDHRSTSIARTRQYRANRGMLTGW
jgi:hypothetical protein